MNTLQKITATGLLAAVLGPLPGLNPDMGDYSNFIKLKSFCQGLRKFCC